MTDHDGEPGAVLGVGVALPGQLRLHVRPRQEAVAVHLWGGGWGVRQQHESRQLAGGGGFGGVRGGLGLDKIKEAVAVHLGRGGF